ncbi:chorismate mutase [Magnetospira sp. QH-2]|uniref:chorismate mutase n=1 Tax=Magnetospira sp. (strain QH-2) TaxID=1288970 RepID=UPI0003E80B06|nr:chorismate mutase [Magnetospira sp. QH-2]CCQ74721.1 putative chorismate mutase [Magnetospira sp. QH-2]
MSQVRAEIDRLDRHILPLLAERSQYVAQAAAFKAERADVVVPRRIEEIIAHIRDIAEHHGMDKDLAEEIYRSMIDTFIRFEERRWDEIAES